MPRFFQEKYDICLQDIFAYEWVDSLLSNGLVDFVFPRPKEQQNICKLSSITSFVYHFTKFDMVSMGFSKIYWKLPKIPSGQLLIKMLLDLTD